MTSRITSPKVLLVSQPRIPANPAPAPGARVIRRYRIVRVVPGWERSARQQDSVGQAFINGG